MCKGLRYHVDLTEETFRKLETLAAIQDSNSISKSIEQAVEEIFDEYFPKIASA